MAQPPSLAKVHLASWVQTHHRVDPPLGKLGHGRIGTKAAITQHHVAFLQLVPEASKEHALMLVEGAGGIVFEPAAGEAEDACQLHAWETQTLFLRRRL